MVWLFALKSRKVTFSYITGPPEIPLDDENALGLMAVVSRSAASTRRGNWLGSLHASYLWQIWKGIAWERKSCSRSEGSA